MKLKPTQVVRAPGMLTNWLFSAGLAWKLRTASSGGYVVRGSDGVEAAALVLGHLAALVSEDRGLDVGEMAGAAAPPVGDVREGQVVLGHVRGQLEGTGADRGGRVGPPRLVGVVGDDLLVDDVGRPEAELGQPVAGRVLSLATTVYGSGAHSPDRVVAVGVPLRATP